MSPETMYISVHENDLGAYVARDPSLINNRSLVLTGFKRIYSLINIWRRVIGIPLREVENNATYPDLAFTDRDL